MFEEETDVAKNASEEPTIVPEKTKDVVERNVDVAQHYNAVPEKGIEERTKSRIFYLRNFNNWIKSMQIGDVIDKIRRGKDRNYDLAVFDMCCGKGGDLLKWKKSNISRLVCADIADVSLDQAKNRYAEMTDRNKSERRPQFLFDAEFIYADISKVRLKELYSDPNIKFDLCSCQFSLHYSFIDQQRAKCMLRNACECLKPGGYFIGTIPNADHLVYLARQNESMKFENEVCSFHFDSDSMSDDGRFPLFGAKYHFTLDEVVNLPEFLIYFPLLEEMLKDLDMELIYVKSFADVVQEKANGGEGKGLLARMQALEPYPPEDDVELVSSVKSQYEHAEDRIKQLKEENKNDRRPVCVGTLSKAEWEVAAMYNAFAFRKRTVVDHKEEEIKEIS